MIGILKPIQLQVEILEVMNHYVLTETLSMKDHLEIDIPEMKDRLEIDIPEMQENQKCIL